MPSPSRVVPAWKITVSAGHRAGRLDRRAVGRRRRIVAAGGYHGDAGRADGRHLSAAAQFALGRCDQQVEELRRVDHRQQRLGLRVAEPGVELDDLRTSRGQHQADVKAAAERDPALAQRGQAGRDDVSRDRVQQRVDRLAHRRAVGPHAAGVGPQIAVERALVVAGRRQQPGAGAVADREDRHLAAGEQFLDDHGVAGLAVLALIEAGSERGFDGVHRVADGHALTERQAVGLHRDPAVAGLGELDQLLAIGRAARPPARGRYPGLVHELLGEELRALDPGRCLGRPENQRSRRRAGIGDPGLQGRVRTDDHQVELVLADRLRPAPSCRSPRSAGSRRVRPSRRCQERRTAC